MTLSEGDDLHPVGSFKRNRPWATLTLMGANLAVFLLQIPFFLFNLRDAAGHTLLAGWLGLSVSGVARLKLWQPFSFSFLNEDPLGLLFTLLVLWFFAPSLETHLGRFHGIAIYLTGALAGAVLFIGTCLALGADGLVLAGAGCAAGAVFTAFATLYPNALLLFGIKAKYWALVPLVFGLWSLAVYKSPGSLAILGALAAGFIYIRTAARRGAGGWLAFLHRATIGRLERVWAERARRQQAAREEFISRSVDPILEKISKHGLQSLTKEERKILDRASRQLGRH